MPIRLVAIDLDGTLLNSAKQVTDTTAAILRAARAEAGVHIVLASARPPRSVIGFYTLLDLDAPMINYNGALVYNPVSRRVLLHRPIPLDTARPLVDLARSIYPEVLVSAEVMDHWYTDRLDLAYATETARQFAPDLIAPIDEWLDRDITKLMFLGRPERLTELAGAIGREFLHQVATVQTEGALLQVMHATVSKARALRVVAGELCTAREQVMAIGDNANDVDMLQWAGIGVAMGNAPAEVRAVADFVTDSHDADGAARAVSEMILKGSPPKDRQ
ncbi:MAG: HAD family phosphatase [Phycisphaerae bacterium]|nr:HAD family phosphatase [Phycisphaerae bacterium]